MKVDALKKVTDKLKGKKAKVKKLPVEPSGTKAAKLPAKLADSMKEVFETDFSKVRVHTGGNAADLAKSLKAQAFTQGPNIYLAKSGDAANMKLLAHELTHVVQQSGGRIPKAKPGKAMTSK